MAVIDRVACVYKWFRGLSVALIFTFLMILAFYFAKREFNNSSYTEIKEMEPKLLTSTDVDTCGFDQEIRLTKEASITLTLKAMKNKGICKLRVLAPKSHVVKLQIVETISAKPNNISKLNPSELQPRSACLMNVFISDNPKVPHWKEDLCSDEDLFIGLLAPDFRIIWNPPANVLFLNDKQLVFTSIGQGETCKEPEQHVCMKIGGIPISCVSRQLLCDGIRNCPTISTSSDEDEILCKKNHTEPILQQAVNMAKYSNSDGDEFRNPESGINTTSTANKPEDKHGENTTDSLSAAFSKRETWNNIYLGMAIYAAVGAFCFLCEFCFTLYNENRKANAFPYLV